MNSTLRINKTAVVVRPEFGQYDFVYPSDLLYTIGEDTDIELCYLRRTQHDKNLLPVKFLSGPFTNMIGFLLLDKEK